MKNSKQLRDAAAALELDRLDKLDDRLEERRHSRERAKRVAALRCDAVRAAVKAPAAEECVTLTRHAAHRMQNRAITIYQVLLLTDYGRPQRVHGATRYALDRPARDLLQRTLPAEQLRSLRSLDIVAVFSDDGALITASHRTQRLRRKVSHH